MRSPTRGEAAAGLAGGVALASALWVLETPPAVHPLWIYKAIATRTLVGACGSLLLILAARSWLRQRQERARRRSLAIAGRIGLAALSAGVTIAAAEGILQWTAPEPPENWIRPDPILHHSQKPGSRTRFISSEWDTAVAINSLGLRDDEISEKPEGITRVVVLGDSYAFGYGVEADEAFPAVLERLCAAQALSVDVVNAGIPSYSPTLEYLFLREHWAALEPDIVVLALDMSDFQDDLWFEDLAVYDAGGRLERVGPTPRPGRLRSLYKDLLLVRMFRAALDRLYARWRSGEELDLPQTRDLAHNRFALTRDDLTAAESEPHWQRTLGWMTRIAELVTAHGARLLTVTYPYGHQVAVDEWEAGRQHYGFARDKVYPATPGERVERWGEETGTPVLNLFPVFRERSDGVLYFPYDGHFTPEAHVLAGTEIFRRLVELDWLEPTSGEPGGSAAVVSSAGPRWSPRTGPSKTHNPCSVTTDDPPED